MRNEAARNKFIQLVKDQTEAMFDQCSTVEQMTECIYQNSQLDRTESKVLARKLEPFCGSSHPRTLHRRMVLPMAAVVYVGQPHLLVHADHENDVAMWKASGARDWITDRGEMIGFSKPSHEQIVAIAGAWFDMFAFNAK